MVWTCGKNATIKTVKEVFKTIPEGISSVGKPRKRWLYDDENGCKRLEKNS
jgi:hypothetical protein